MAGNESGWDGIERRRMPHPYEILQHVDSQIAELRTEIVLLKVEVGNLATRLETAEAAITTTQGLIREAVGMRRLFGWIVSAVAAAWVVAKVIQGHFHW